MISTLNRRQKMILAAGAVVDVALIAGLARIIMG
jgi:hypothetical protein